MGRFKRTLQGYQPLGTAKRATGHGATILCEGFAIRGTTESLDVALPSPSYGTPRPVGGTVDPHPYSRGCAQKALAAARDPEQCIAGLWADATASTSKGRQRSCQTLWESLARAAGYEDPFALTPNLIYTVMGALKVAHYRSAVLRGGQVYPHRKRRRVDVPAGSST